MGKSVLPKLPKRLDLPERIEDLLSPEEQEALQRDLNEMARQRRDAEAWSANYHMS